MHNSRQYWLSHWMDRHSITSIAGARAALQCGSARDDAIHIAATYLPVDACAPSGPIILAGRALDLSGDLDVYAWDIMRRRVDTLFKRVWHYFDKVIIVGADARHFAERWTDKAKFDERLLLFVQLILYLREIGAEDLVLFVQKPE